MGEGTAPVEERLRERESGHKGKGSRVFHKLS